MIENYVFCIFSVPYSTFSSLEGEMCAKLRLYISYGIIFFFIVQLLMFIKVPKPYN